MTCRPNDSAARAPSSIRSTIQDRSAPGNPRHTGQVFELGSSPKASSSRKRFLIPCSVERDLQADNRFPAVCHIVYQILDLKFTFEIENLRFEFPL